MGMAYVLLRCIGKAVVKNVVNLFTFGVGGDILVDAWDYWQEASKEGQRPGQVEAVAQLSAAELREEVARIVREEAATLPPAQQAQVATYLGQVPAMIRRSLRRPSDPTGKTTETGTVFRKPADLAPLLPAGLPRFKAGDRPLPGVDWELVDLLGVGGFGEVWKARNPRLDAWPPVALKFCLDPAAKERLLTHEAKIISQVMQQGKHEGIVPLLHAYLSADPPCLEYEYIDGGDLAGLLQGRKGGGLAAPEAARVIQRLAEIVGFAHRLSPPVVHRDLKPANVLVKPRPGGKLGLRITDFGIGGLAIQQAVAQSRRASKHVEFLTAALRGSYTPLYGSPQQMRGEDPDPRDDVYALGVIWHQLLTGDLTKGRPGGEAWRKRLTDRGMTPAMLALLAASFEDEREDRPDNALELAERLAPLLGGSVPPPPPPEPPSPPSPRPDDDLATIHQRNEQVLTRAHSDARRKIEQDHDYTAAVTILEAVPEHRRDAKMLQTAVKKRDRAAELDTSVRAKVLATRTDGLREEASELLELLPHRTDLRRMLETLPKGPEKQFANSIGMKFTLIPAGTFLMGSPDDEPGRQPREGPQHEVTISRPFYLGICPVTQREFQAVIRRNPSEFKGNWFRGNPDNPVEQVSWEEAVEFCRRMSALAAEKQSGRVYCLPTEAEWEYACRAGTTTPFHFGTTISTDQANYFASSCKTTPVGSFPANAWGLFDMHGNVWEWCADWFDGDYYQKRVKKDPKGPDNGGSRVMRGGSWMYSTGYCRAAYRGREWPGTRSNDYGLRVCFRLD